MIANDERVLRKIYTKEDLPVLKKELEKRRIQHISAHGYLNERDGEYFEDGDSTTDLMDTIDDLEHKRRI